MFVFLLGFTGRWTHGKEIFSTPAMIVNLSHSQTEFDVGVVD